MGNIAGGWRNFNVLTLDPGSAVTYVITRTSAEPLSIQSREAPNKPQLIVEYTMPITTPMSVCSPRGCVESKPWIYTNSWSIVVADFNGDGREDHLVARHVEGDQIYLQQPDGSFSPGFPLPPRDRHGCAAGDINSDGRIDLFCALGAGGGEGFKRDELG